MMGTSDCLETQMHMIECITALRAFEAGAPPDYSLMNYVAIG
jgi:hypothetical protein